MDATERAGTGSELGALPRIDEHSAVIDRGVQATWASLLHVVEASFSSGLAPRFTRALGCADTAAGGPRPLAPGSTLPGFHVAEASSPRKLVLLGSHRYSRYALSFALEELDEGQHPTAGRDPRRVPRPEGHDLQVAGDRQPHPRSRHPPTSHRCAPPRQPRVARSLIAEAVPSGARLRSTEKTQTTKN